MVSFLSSSSLEREEYGVSRIPHRADSRQRLHTGCLYVQHCDMTATRARDKQTFNSSAHRSTTAGSRSKCGVNRWAFCKLLSDRNNAEEFQLIVVQTTTGSRSTGTSTRAQIPQSRDPDPGPWPTKWNLAAWSNPSRGQVCTPAWECSWGRGYTGVPIRLLGTPNFAVWGRVEFYEPRPNLRAKWGRVWSLIMAHECN